MSKIIAKFSTIKILFGLIILVLVAVGYSLKSTPSAQAVQDPVCDAYTRWACSAGTSQNTGYDAQTHCWTWQCTWGYTINCDKCTGCGNEQIDAGEDCDGSLLNGESCISRGYDGGTLRCFANSCLFDEGGCTLNAGCGNGLVENAERCDRANFNKIENGININDTNNDGLVNCRDFGLFTGGTLSCFDAGSPDECNFNTTRCSVCGNNIKEGSEECDGADFGGKTCSDYSCDPGPLSCFDCKIVDPTTTCSNCQVFGACQTRVSSPWSTPGLINKPCCGPVNETVVEDLTETSFGLCNGSRQPSGFTKTNMAGQPIVNPGEAVGGWSWQCGGETCSAIKRASCAESLSTENYSCSPDVIWDSFADYQGALVANNRSLCDGGVAVDDKTCGLLDKNWPSINKEWFCIGRVPKGQTPAENTNKARCLTGWAPDSTCGNAHGVTYTTGTGECRTDTNWQTFLSLAGRGDRDVALCKNGSRVYNRDTAMRYWQVPPANNLDNQSPTYFGWQCQYDDPNDPGARKGKVVDCQAKVDPKRCRPGEPICGLAANRKYSYPGPGPADQLCLSGKVGNRGVEFAYVGNPAVTPRWSWECISTTDSTKKVTCRVEATTFCGLAATSKDLYPTKADVLAAELCAGSDSELFIPEGRSREAAIEDRGTYWQWYCVAKNSNNQPSAVCKASNGKCGEVGGRVMLANTFANKVAAGRLCPAGITPQPLLASLTTTEFNESFKVDEWKWRCGSTNCSARVLACGQANGQNEFKSIFDAQRAATPTYLCTSNFGQVNYNYEDNLDTSAGAKTAVWTWNCLGDFGDQVNGCSANRLACGWANGRKVNKFWDEDWPTNIKNQRRWPAGGLTNNDEFCTYNAVADNLSITGLTASWRCRSPQMDNFGNYKYENCSANLTTCGTATNYKDFYNFAASSALTKPTYYKSTLDSRLNANDDFLCVNSLQPSRLTDNGTTLNWVCFDDFYTGQNKFDGSGQGACEVLKPACGTINNWTYQGGGTLNITASDSPWVRGYYENSTFMCFNGRQAVYDKNNNQNKIPRWFNPRENNSPDRQVDWYCTDDAGNEGQSNDSAMNCQAFCVNCLYNY